MNDIPNTQHYKWIEKVKKNNIRLARSENVLRSIDDLMKLNDGEKFTQGFIEIYPLKLLLKKENI